MAIKEHEKRGVDYKQLREELADERLSHIASILDYRYGVDAIPGIDLNHGEYSVFMTDEDSDIRIAYTFDIDDMIKANTEQEANRLWHFYMYKVSQCRVDDKEVSSM